MTGSSSGARAPDPVDLDRAGVRADRMGDVLNVTLARPDVRNAQTPAMWRALAAVGEHLDPAVRVVVLRGDGPSFSAGLDRAMLSAAGIPGEASLAGLVEAGESATIAAIEEYQRAFTWWSAADAVTVAVVHGHAVGAGFQLALACDLRVVADDARFSMREVTLGLVPDLGGTKALVDLVGLSRALDIVATGRWVEAAEAEKLGLANAVVPLAEVEAAVVRYVTGLLAPPHGAVTAVKALLRGSRDRTPDEQRAAERSAQYGRLRELAQLSRAQRSVRRTAAGTVAPTSSPDREA